MVDNRAALRLIVAALAALASMGISTCKTGLSPSEVDCNANAPGPSDYVAPGPYATASKGFDDWADSSRSTPANTCGATDLPGCVSAPPTAARKLPTQVWYPTSTSRGPAPPWPIIAYAHGFMGTGLEADYNGPTDPAGHGFASHLASYGYVVVAPTFPLSSRNAPGGPTLADAAQQPGDLNFVMDQVAQLWGASGSIPGGGSVDSSRRGLLGWSMGGATVVTATDHPSLKIPRISAAVINGTGSCFFGRPIFAQGKVPILVTATSADMCSLMQFSERAYIFSNPIARFAILMGGTHLGYLGIDWQSSGTNPDKPLCLAHATTSKGITDWQNDLKKGLGAGAIDEVGCLKPENVQSCPDRVPTMPAARQTQLARALAVSAFDAVFGRNSKKAVCFARNLARDSSDVILAEKW